MPRRRLAKLITLVDSFIFPPLLPCEGLWARQEAHLPLPPRGRLAILCITELDIRQNVLTAGRDAATIQVRDGPCRNSASDREFVSQRREAPQWGTIPTVSEPAPIQQGRA